MTTIEQTNVETNWYSLAAADVVQQLDTDSEQGLAEAEVQRRLARYGPHRQGDPTPRAAPIMACVT